MRRKRIFVVSARPTNAKVTPMRHLLCSQLVLLFFLLLLHYVSVYPAVATAQRCAFDKVMRGSGGPRPVEVVRELPGRGRGALQTYTAAAEQGIEWAPIRIKVFTADLRKPQRYCKMMIGESDKRSTVEICEEKVLLKDKQIDVLVNTIIPMAVKLHADRLLVEPAKGLLVVPRFGNNSFCAGFTVPESHHTAGVDNADIVLYVNVVRGHESFAAPCATKENGRPIAAAVNVALGELRTQSLIVRILAHEIAHALGFGIDEMKKLGMVSRVPDVRASGKAVDVVSSPKTLERAREHYECDTLKGMELEREDDEKDEFESHWSLRNAKDELMSPNVGESAGYYTSLTMAAFDDMKFYKANWGMEETMGWGANSGCGFLDKRCTSGGAKEFSQMFCNVENGTALCTSDRLAVGHCSGYALEAGATLEKWEPFNVTSDKEDNYSVVKSSTSALPDGVCTFFKAFYNRTVAVPVMPMMCSMRQVDVLPGSLSGANSWCLDAESLRAQSASNNTVRSVRAVCAQVLCDGGEVKVKYLGGSDFVPCPEGGSITPTSSYFAAGNGKIKCPKYSEVCTMSTNGSSLIMPPKQRGLEGGDSAAARLSSIALLVVVAVALVA